MSLSTAKIILGAISIVLSIVILVIIMIQQGKNDGLGAMAGGTAADAQSYFNKNQKKSRDAILAKITVVCSVILAIAVVAMNFIVQ